MVQALLVIDLQNDYSDVVNFQLWNTEQTLANIECWLLTPTNILQIAVKRLPHFLMREQREGIHPRILAAAPNAPIVVKAYADSFYQTNLSDALKQLNVNELLVCGTCTQTGVTTNCHF